MSPQRKEARIRALVSSPIFAPIAVFEKLNRRSKFMTVVGDTLSAA
jgi:hypothetical protein